LKVRELELKDNYLLVKWLSDPAVLQYYEGRDNPFDLEKVNKVFYTPEVEEVRCIIEDGENAIGYIQFYQLEQQAMEEYGYTNLKEIIFGTDQFIGEPKYWDKGIGKC
jgi:aminoglycoside 6'-N-acetyltransferase